MIAGTPTPTTLHKEIHIEELRDRIVEHFFAPASTLALLQRFCAIQIDPVSVVAQNQNLVFAARAASGQIPDLSRLYKDGRIIELYAKERCIVLRDDAPLFRPLIERRRENRKTLLRKHRARVEQIMRIVQRLKALTPGDLEAMPSQQADGWGSRSLSTMLLNVLWEIGRLTVSGRQGTRVTYTLSPDNLWHTADTDRMTPEELRLARWRRYLDGVALTDSQDIFAGFERCDAESRRRMFNDLIEIGAAIKVTGLGSRIMSVVSSKLLRMKIGSRQTLPCFVPPLDNFIWHRRLAKRLWSLDYRWEIYTPPAQRRFGAFAMPLVTNRGVYGPVNFQFDRAHSALYGDLSISPIDDQGAQVREEAEAAAHKLACAVGAQSVTLR
jgi:hypothetical protein